MKKAIVLMLLVILTFSVIPVSSAETNFAALTDEELAALITGATEELNRRHLGENRFYLPVQAPYVIYATGNLEWKGSGSYPEVKVEVVIENPSDDEPPINVSYQTVNGWDADASTWYSCAPHSKKISLISFSVKRNPEVSSLDDVTSLTLKFNKTNSGVTLIVQDGKIVSCINNTY